MVKSPPDFQTFDMTPLSDDDMMDPVPATENTEPVEPHMQPEMVVSPHPDSPYGLQDFVQPVPMESPVPIHLPDKGLTAWLAHMQRKQTDRSRSSLIESLKGMFT